MTRRRGTRMAARSEASGGGRKSAGVLRVVGVVALVAAALAIGAVRMGFLHLPGSHDDDSMLAKGDDNTATYATPAPTKPAPGPAEGVNLDAPAVEPGAPAPAEATPAKRPGSRLASRAAPVARSSPRAPRRPRRARGGARRPRAGGSHAGEASRLAPRVQSSSRGAVVTAVTPESPRRTAQ